MAQQRFTARDAAGVAASIKANVAAVNARRISWDEFSERQRKAWDSVSRGELAIIGSACSRRLAAVHKLLAEVA